MGVRNSSAGARVKDDIMKGTPTANIDMLDLDLSSRSSVKRFVENFNALNLPLNILINNAGIAFVPFKLSEDGVELHFATNHLGHFLLTDLLLDNIKSTSKESGIEGRIVIVASDGHKHPYREGIRFDKINDESGYSNLRAYGQSKLANILHSNELSSCLKERNEKVIVNSLHPGGVVTNILRDWSFLNSILLTVGKFILKDVQQGAATVCYLALHPQVAGITGKYFVDCNVTELKSHATDQDLAKKLWDFSVGLLS